MFGWIKTVDHYRRKYERQFNKSGYSNENLWRYFAENKTFSLPKKWTRSKGEPSDQSYDLNTSLHRGFTPESDGNAPLNYYKNIYAAAKNYSDAKERQTWAAWSSQGKERLGQAKAMQAMIRRRLMTPEQFEKIKNYLLTEFSKIKIMLVENDSQCSDDIIKQTRDLAHFAEMFLSAAGQKEFLSLDAVRDRCNTIQILPYLKGKYEQPEREIYLAGFINSLLTAISNATLPAPSPN